MSSISDRSPSSVWLVLPWSPKHQGGVTGVVQQIQAWWGDLDVRPQLVVNDWGASTPLAQGQSLHIRLHAVSTRGPLGFVTSLRHLPSTLWRTYQLLRQQSVVAVNFHYTDTAPFGVALLKRIGAYRGRLVISFHGTDVKPASGLIDRLVRSFCYGTADCLVACSASLADRMASTLGVQRDAVSVVPNGVDAGVFYPDAPLAIRFVDWLPSRYLISVGAFIARKAHGDLIDAFSSVSAVHPDLHLIIAGAPGPLLDESRLQIDALKLEGRVHLLVGLQQGELAGLLSKALLCVQAALAESMPLSVLEAGASGVPLAVSRIPGHVELIQEPETGFLFQAGSSESCAQAILGALSDMQAARSRADRFRKRVRTELTWSACVAAYRNLYGLGPTHATRSM